MANFAPNHVEREVQCWRRRYLLLLTIAYRTGVCFLHSTKNYEINCILNKLNLASASKQLTLDLHAKQYFPGGLPHFRSRRDEEGGSYRRHIQTFQVLPFQYHVFGDARSFSLVCY